VLTRHLVVALLGPHRCALLGWMAWKDATARALDGTGRERDHEIIES
jgi:hypothetical protein